MSFGPYPATVMRVVDGDTAWLRLDLGFGIAMTLKCRVAGVNAPELRTASGKAARDFLAALLRDYTESAAKAQKQLAVRSLGWDKYGGRFDGQLTLEDATDVADTLVTAGHAERRNY